MPVLPGTASFEELAGALNNYAEVVDPTTDLPALADNIARANVAALSRLAPRIVFVYTTSGSTGTVTPGSFDSVVGVGAVNYPIFAKVADGQWRLVFPVDCTDSLGETQAWAFKRARATVESGAPAFSRGVKVDPNTIDIFTWTAAGVADDLAGESIRVEVY